MAIATAAMMPITMLSSIEFGSGIKKEPNNMNSGKWNR